MPRTKNKSSSSVVSPKRQIKLPSKNSASSVVKTTVKTTPKKVQKGRMSVDNEQMLKDLVELGRIKDSSFVASAKKKKSNINNSFIDISNSSFVNFIQNKIHGPYLKVAIAFLVLVSVFFLSILYVVSSKAVINIHLKKVSSNAQIQRPFNVYDYSELSKINNSAVVVSVPLEVSVQDSYSVSTQQVKLSKAEGKIKIVNNTDKSQGLIATTRFISGSTGDLYRLKTSVNVPANSSVEAYVVADKESNVGESIGTKFVIPGLKSEEVQKLIYGESVSDINLDGVAKAIVTAEDMNKATSFLEVKLRQGSISSLNEKMSKNPDFIMVADSLDFKITSSSIGASVGQEADKISLSGKASTNALFVNKNKILDIIKSDILSKNYSGNVVKIIEDSLSYSLSKMDLISKVVTLNISVDSAISYDVNKILNREDLVGMDINDFYVYAQDKNFANRIQVVSYPFWNSHLPKISENIIIRVK